MLSDLTDRQESPPELEGAMSTDSAGSCLVTLLSKEPVDAKSLYGFKKRLGNCM